MIVTAPDVYKEQLASALKRVHPLDGKAWICVDPLASDPSHETGEGWRPTRPLDTCDRCKD